MGATFRAVKQKYVLHFHFFKYFELNDSFKKACNAVVDNNVTKRREIDVPYVMVVAKDIILSI